MNNMLFASLGFSACSLFFAVFIMIMYLSKKRFKNLENTVFIALLISIFVLIAFEFTYVLLLYFDKTSIAKFFCRAWLNGIIIWMTGFTYYIIILRTRIIKDVALKTNTRKKVGIIFIVVSFLSLLASNYLPIEFYDYNYHVYSFAGEATNIAFLIAAITLMTMIYAFIFRKDLVDSVQRRVIAYVLIIILIVTSIQVTYPELDCNYQNFEFVLLLMTLFFTFENQDNKLLIEHQKSKEEAEVANAKQTQFLTSVTIGIRTPMSVIMGYSDAILREKNITQEIVKSDTNNIHIAAINLLELINNILDLSRIESGKETIIEKEYATQNLLVEINDFVLSKIDKEKVRFEIIVDPNLPKKLMGDYTKVYKIITNALLNVINYTKQGGIMVKATFGNTNTGFQFICAIISENSEIEEEEYKTFYLTENEEDDLGNTVNEVVLGVNVAKRYAEMLNGKLYMTNKDRYNVSYSIEVDEKVVDSNPIGNISTLFVTKTENVAVNLTGKKVLVVDDNMLNIKLLKRLLVDYNATIDSASSGSECIEKVKNGLYDIIFLDHMMPGMDGIETLNEIKKIREPIPPTIALTANSYTGVKEFYMNSGFTDYLAKPINKLELNKLLNNILKN